MSESFFLSAQEVAFQINYTTLFSHLSFHLMQGESLALRGPNGCGKTSLLRILAGLVAPHSGSLCYKENARPVFLATEPALLLDLNVLQNLHFFLGAHLQKESDFTLPLARVGLTHREKQRARSLSAGQKRRLILAGLLALKPQLILADEPTNGLDKEGVDLCLEIFDELKENIKTTFVISSHDEKLLNWCDKEIHLINYRNKTVQNKIKIAEII